MKHPIQQIIDVDGIHRFRPNKIVCYLLKIAPTDLNELARLGDLFSDDDWEQFAQLMGYSVSGFCDLSYASDEIANAALAQSEQLAKSIEDAKILASYCADANKTVVDGIGGPIKL